MTRSHSGRLLLVLSSQLLMSRFSVFVLTDNICQTLLVSSLLLHYFQSLTQQQRLLQHQLKLNQQLDQRCHQPLLHQLRHQLHHQNPPLQVHVTGSTLRLSSLMFMFVWDCLWASPSFFSLPYFLPPGTLITYHKSLIKTF